MDTVLVVESEAITRYCLVEALLHRGYRVVEAWNSSDALARLHSFPGTLRALIVEVFFSDLTAKTLACQMKRYNPKLCVIAFSTLCPHEIPADLPYDAALEKP